LTATASPAPAIPAAPKKSTLAWVADILVWGGVAAVLLYSIDAVDLGNISRLFAGNDSTKLFVHDLLRPDFADWKMFVAKMWETVQIALWGTFLAVILGIPLGLAAARNIAPAWIVTPVRWVMNLLRSVPDLVIGLLFVTAVGLGPLAGVLAITLNTAGVLAKLFSEAVESIDKGPVEGVRATGAGKLHEIVWGVLPQVAPLWTSFALYRTVCHHTTSSLPVKVVMSVTRQCGHGLQIMRCNCMGLVGQLSRIGPNFVVAGQVN